VIIAEGDAADRFYVIEEGEVAVSRQSSEGDEIELATLGPGQFFGEDSDRACHRRRQAARFELAGIQGDARGVG
jgi:CRP-like cAMP-binding protein